MDENKSTSAMGGLISGLSIYSTTEKQVVNMMYDAESGGC